MSFTATVTQLTGKANGLSIYPRVITGAAVSQPGTVAGSQSTGASQAITPAGTGSWVYGAILGGNTTLTALAANSPFAAQVTQNSLRYVALRSISTTTSGTGITLGASSATTGLDTSLCEILVASGQTLAEDGSSPAVSSVSNAQFLATNSFTGVPAGATLLLIVTSNGGTGTTTVSVTDTSGLGLTWTEHEPINGASKGYAGTWTARMPAAANLGAFFQGWTP